MPDILPLPGMPSPPPGMPMGGIPGMMGMPGMPGMPSLPGAPPAPALPAPMPVVNSNVVRIKQVFTVDGETDDSDFTDVMEDMKGGCSAHGTIKSIFIVRPSVAEALPDCTLADVFIEFSSNTEAGTCIGKMTGRKYDGKQIAIESYDYAKWE